jgi:hypothetical protein
LAVFWDIYNSDRDKLNIEICLFSIIYKKNVGLPAEKHPFFEVNTLILRG